ncbi:hypothetical protein BDP27DRAFT_1362781 [Rhodocollybia butyracea]|uniref:Uncharacterized protein n=1 Tax=Rhodocollybia butyracea TaxID=206335 RepID=A0A9P5U9N4_9AGAR|nr:hypothetical protein BDP27DRAFT_1362781 [Rhodocollybia butyracea]
MHGSLQSSSSKPFQLRHFRGEQVLSLSHSVTSSDFLHFTTTAGLRTSEDGYAHSSCNPMLEVLFLRLGNKHTRAPWSGFAIVSLCRRTSNQPEGIAVALSPEA